MRCAAKLALVTLLSVVSAARISGQVEIPKAAEGYTITKGASTSRKAPEGYEGTTDIATETAEGNTAATKGKTYVSHFTMSNEVRMCPQADGTVDGDGEFSLSVDYTGRPPAPASSFHAEMITKAKYKGMVGDDAMMSAPVTAEIDYDYSVSGSGSGAPKPSNAAQHLTTHFAVGKLLSAPAMDPFNGGDFDTGHLEQALGAATALTFWGGIYYSFSQTEWLHPSRCVQVAFDPPSHSRQPVLGGDTKVNAQIKTRGGEGVRGKFDDVRADPGGGAVAITSSATDPGSPAIFTYTAPNKQIDNAGFKVAGTSRGGAVEGRWDTGLGTGWNGEIDASRVVSGDVGSDDLQSWSNYEVMRVFITVKDGVGTAYQYGESRNVSINRQRALRGGAMTYIEIGNDNSFGTAQGGTQATVGVILNPNGTYMLNMSFLPVTGTEQFTSCAGVRCTSGERQFGVASIMPLITGKVDDPNHVHGSQNVQSPAPGKSGKGRSSYTLTWDLARRGTTK